MLSAVAIGWIGLPRVMMGILAGWPLIGVAGIAIMMVMLLDTALRGTRFDHNRTVKFGSALALSVAMVMLVNRSFVRAAGKPVISGMKSELRNLADAQKAYLDSAGRFAADLTELGFRSSVTGAQVQLIEVTDAGWRAIVTHNRITDRCEVAVTRQAPIPGDIECKR